MEKFIRKLKLRALNKQMQRYYNCSPRFREYVDRCSKTYGNTISETLSHALTREVAKYYQESDVEECI